MGSHLKCVSMSRLTLPHANQEDVKTSWSSWGRQVGHSHWSEMAWKSKWRRLASIFLVIRRWGQGLVRILCVRRKLGFPCGSAGKESTCNVGDLGSNPGLGRSPGDGKVYPLQYSGLENSMDCIVHGFPKSQAWLSNFHSSRDRARRERSGSWERKRSQGKRKSF